MPTQTKFTSWLKHHPCTGVTRGFLLISVFTLSQATAHTFNHLPIQYDTTPSTPWPAPRTSSQGKLHQPAYAQTLHHAAQPTPVTHQDITDSLCTCLITKPLTIQSFALDLILTLCVGGPTLLYLRWSPRATTLLGELRTQLGHTSTPHDPDKKADDHQTSALAATLQRYHTLHWLKTHNRQLFVLSCTLIPVVLIAIHVLMPQLRWMDAIFVSLFTPLVLLFLNLLLRIALTGRFIRAATQTLREHHAHPINRNQS